MYVWVAIDEHKVKVFSTRTKAYKFADDTRNRRAFSLGWEVRKRKVK